MFWSASAWSAAENTSQATRSLVVIADYSGSMWTKLDRQMKYRITADVVDELTEQARQNFELELSLYAFGRRDRSCDDVEQVWSSSAPRSEQKLTQFLSEARPKGRSPLALSMWRAGEHIAQSSRPGSILLITDGAESCGQDLCAVARKLSLRDIPVAVKVVGMKLSPEDFDGLRCVAENTGGEIINSDSKRALSAAVSRAVQGLPLSDEPPLPLQPQLQPQQPTAPAPAPAPTPQTALAVQNNSEVELLRDEIAQLQRKLDEEREKNLAQSERFNDILVEFEALSKEGVQIVAPSPKANSAEVTLTICGSESVDLIEKPGIVYQIDQDC